MNLPEGRSSSRTTWTMRGTEPPATDSPPPRPLPIRRRSFRREDQFAEELKRPLGVSLVEGRATRCDLPRGDLPQHPLTDLRDPFTIPDPHLPRPRKARPHLPLLP